VKEKELEKSEKYWMLREEIRLNMASEQSHSDTCCGWNIGSHFGHASEIY